MDKFFTIVTIFGHLHIADAGSHSLSVTVIILMTVHPFYRFTLLQFVLCFNAFSNLLCHIIQIELCLSIFMVRFIIPTSRYSSKIYSY